MILSPTSSRVPGLGSCEIVQLPVPTLVIGALARIPPMIVSVWEALYEMLSGEFDDIVIPKFHVASAALVVERVRLALADR